MRYLIYFILVCAVGIAIGAWSVFVSLDQLSGLNAIRIGSWSARPFAGSLQVDPYTRAKSSSEGTLAIGLVEGLTFEAQYDVNGARLRRECRYEIAGKNPPARLWSLVAEGVDKMPLESNLGGASALLYNQVVRFPDYSFSISINDAPVAGNWLPVSGTGPFNLIMRIYDTPIATNAGSISPTMPRIELTGCR